MDVILHIGAHRTGTTAFQAYLQANRARLAAEGTAIWLPADIRAGPLAGLMKRPGGRARALADLRLARRLNRALARLRDGGASRLILSEENLLGTMASCLSVGMPYGDAWGRMRRLDRLFGGRIRRVGLGLRAPAPWWASVLAFRLGRGGPVPDAALIGRLASQGRGWEAVATDLAAALAGRTLAIWEFETLVSRPRLVLGALLGAAPPADLVRVAHGRNAAPSMADLSARLPASMPPGLVHGKTGRWMPFSPAQQALLAARHAAELDRLGRLAAGIEIFGATGSRPGAGGWKEGQFDDGQDRRLEGTRAEGVA